MLTIFFYGFIAQLFAIFLFAKTVAGNGYALQQHNGGKFLKCFFTWFNVMTWWLTRRMSVRACSGSRVCVCARVQPSAVANKTITGCRAADKKQQTEVCHSVLHHGTCR